MRPIKDEKNTLPAILIPFPCHFRQAGWIPKRGSGINGRGIEAQHTQNVQGLSSFLFLFHLRNLGSSCCCGWSEAKAVLKTRAVQTLRDVRETQVKREARSPPLWVRRAVVVRSTVRPVLKTKDKNEIVLKICDTLTKL